MDLTVGNNNCQYKFWNTWNYSWNKIPNNDNNNKNIFEEIKKLYQIYLVIYNHDLLQFKEEKFKLAIDQPLMKIN